MNRKIFKELFTEVKYIIPIKMTGVFPEILRLLVVMALLVVAAALATPPGRLPLALRGVYKIMRRDRALSDSAQSVSTVATWKRLLAFGLVIVALILALI